jgi:hypothetical protein
MSEVEEERQAEEKLSAIKRKMATFEWDISHNQLHEGKKAYYESLKKEKEEIERKLKETKTE